MHKLKMMLCHTSIYLSKQNLIDIHLSENNLGSYQFWYIRSKYIWHLTFDIWSRGKMGKELKEIKLLLENDRDWIEKQNVQKLGAINNGVV